MLIYGGDTIPEGGGPDAHPFLFILRQAFDSTITTRTLVKLYSPARAWPTQSVGLGPMHASNSARVRVRVW